MKLFLIIFILVQISSSQSDNKKSPSSFWISLSNKEKISFINGTYSALSVLKKKHKDEVAKQYLHDKNWIQPYYIDRYYSIIDEYHSCLLYTSPSPRDGLLSRMPSSA